MASTAIQWTDQVWNPTIGCTRVSEGCSWCYAEKYAARLPAMGHPEYDGLTQKHADKSVNWTGDVHLLKDRLLDPYGWKKPKRVFVNSMSDLFHERVPNYFIQAVFVVMAKTPHTYQVLTKRPERMLAFLENRANTDFWAPYGNPLPNVWLGVSTENQETADERIPVLLNTPAAVRFISAEPLLSGLNLSAYLGAANGRVQESGRGSLQSNSIRRTGDRRSGEGLEISSPALESLDATNQGDSLQEEASRAQLRGISTGQNDDQRAAVRGSRSSSSMASFPRPNPTRTDGQSQGWQEEAERTYQPGISNLLGANTARYPRVGVQPNAEPNGLTWVIAGGLSAGPKDKLLVRRDLPKHWVSKPEALQWVRDLRDQCVLSGTPYFFKQFGGPTNHAGGRLLDGREWNQFPDGKGGISG